MAANFPDSPSINDTFTDNGLTFVWNGEAWKLNSSSGTKGEKGQKGEVGAKIDGYRIGGKTGTSQKAINGIYSEKKACSFVAILPVDNPKYLVFVLIDEPNKPYAYGSTVAVPVAKEIIDSLIVLDKLPPSEKENSLIVNKPLN